MIDCLDSSALRAHLDAPEPLLDAHLDTCPSCTRMLRSVADDAGYARRALALLDAPPIHLDVDAALASVVRDARADDRGVRGPNPVRRLPPLHRVAIAAASAAAVAFLALTPTARTAVAEALDAFRGERLQVVTVDGEEFAALLDPAGVESLAGLGDLDLSGVSEPRRVDEAEEAEAISGISVPAVSEEADRLVALAPGTARLVLEARTDNGVPDALDGSALIVDIPGAVASIHVGPDGAPEYLVARSGVLSARSEGAGLEEIRRFLLARDEIPADLRAQLAAIDDWRSTIPVPVPLDGPGWRELDIDGRPALVFGDDSGLGAVVIRQDGNGVTVAMGRLEAREAISLVERS